MPVSTNGNSRDYDVVRHPLSNPNTPGEFCNYNCDGNKNTFESSYALDSCRSDLNAEPSTPYIEKITNYTCDNSNRFFDLHRYNYKCYPEEEAIKGKLYFNSCYDFDNVVADFENTTSPVQTYSFGFWFKLDLINYDCPWNTDAFNGSPRRYLFYSNNHTIEVSADKTKLLYELLGIEQSKIEIPNINPYSWNQLTFYIENTNIVYHTRVFLNYKERTTLIPFNLNTPTAVEESKIIIPIGDIRLNLRKVGFCHRPNCLVNGDNVRMSAAFYKDLFYNRGIVPFYFIFDDTLNNYFTLSMTIMYSDLNFIDSSLSKNNYFVYNSVQRNRINFFYVDSNTPVKSLFLKHHTTLNYSTNFDWEFENKSNVIVGYKSKAVTNLIESHQCSVFGTSNVDYYIETNICPVGCARCFANGVCYECITPDNDPTGNKRSFYYSEGTCLPGQRIRYAKVPPKHIPTEGEYSQYVRMPLNSVFDQYAIKMNPNSNLNILSGKEMTISIFIKYKSYFFGTCQSNTLMKFHNDLILCYEESDDSVKLVNSRYIPYVSISNFLGLNFIEWKYLSLSLNLNASVTSGKGFMSFNIGRSENYITREEILRPPSLNLQEYFFNIYYKYTLYLYDFRVYRTFVHNSFGLLRNNSNLLSKLHNSLSLVTTNVRSEAFNDEAKNTCFTWDMITHDSSNAPYLNDFYCEYDNGYNEYYRGPTCTEGDVLMCGTCHPDCYGNCVTSQTSECTCENETGQYFLTRQRSINNFTSFRTQCQRLDYIEFSRIKKNTVTQVGLSDTNAYSIDFWVYIYAYSDDIEYDLFNEFSLIWNYHIKVTVKNNKFIEKILQNAAEIEANPEIQAVYKEFKRNKLELNCYPQYVPATYNPDGTVTAEPAYSNVSFKASKEINIGLWTHLQCIVNNNSDVMMASGNDGITYALTTPGYNFAEKPAELTTTSLVYETTSLANYGLLMLKNINLWKTDNIKTLITNRCVFSPLSLFPGLLHNFSAKYITGEIGLRKVNENSISSVDLQNNFDGYGMINNLIYENAIDDFETCLHMTVSPIEGTVNKTVFTVTCSRNEEIPPLNSTYTVYSLVTILPDPVSFTQNALDPSKFTLIYPSTIASPDLVEDFVILDVICKNTYYDEVSSREVSEFASEKVKIIIDRDINIEKENKANQIKVISKEKNTNVEKLVETVAKVHKLLFPDKEEIIETKVNENGEIEHTLLDGSTRTIKTNGEIILNTANQIIVDSPNGYYIITDKITGRENVIMKPSRLPYSLPNDSETGLTEITGTCTSISTDGLTIWEYGCKVYCPIGQENHLGTCYVQSQKNDIIRGTVVLMTDSIEFYEFPLQQLIDEINIPDDADERRSLTESKNNSDNKLRYLQSSDNAYLEKLDSEGIKLLQRLMEITLSEGISLDAVNNSYLKILNNILTSNSQSIINLVIKDHATILKMIEQLFEFYYSSLQRSKYDSFKQMLYKNTDKNLTFDATFISIKPESFNKTTIYSRISSLSETKEYVDTGFVLRLTMDSKLNAIYSNYTFPEVDFSKYSTFFSSMKNFLNIIGKNLITNHAYEPGSLNRLQYSYPSTGTFIFSVRQVDKFYNFKNLIGNFPYRSYFDAQELVNASSKTFYLLYILVLTDTNNLKNPDPTLLDCLNFDIYTEEKSLLMNYDKPVKVYLTFGNNIEVSNYAIKNAQKYTAQYETMQKNHTDMIQQPYYMDENGLIFFEYTQKQRIEELHKHYLLSVDGVDSLLNEELYLVGELKENTESVCGGAVKNPANYTMYDNDYFWERMEIFSEKSNIDSNPTFFVLVICTGFFILLAFIFMLFKPNTSDTPSTLEALSSELNNRFSKVAFTPYGVSSTNAYKKRGQSESRLKIANENDNSVLDLKNEQLHEVNNMSFCAAFESLISTNRFSSIFSENGVIEPKYKKMLHFTIYFVSNILFFSLYITFTTIDYLEGKSSDVIPKIIGYAIAAIVTSNTLMVIIVYINRVEPSVHNQINQEFAQGRISEEVKSAGTKNLIKFIITFIVFCGIFAVAFISAVGFSAYWARFKGLIAVVTPLMMIADFIIFDLLYSAILATLHVTGLTTLFKLFNIYKFTRVL